LPLLAETDLAALGVLLGHRKLLLQAIAALDEPTSTGRPSPGDSLLSEGSPGAERRHLTVLFCDLVGSTELVNNLDPEVLDARGVLAPVSESFAEGMETGDIRQARAVLEPPGAR